MNRLKWLKQHMHSFSLSRAWLWYYRLGFRKGKKKGIEIGKQQGQRFEIINRCEPHKSDLSLQVVQLFDGRFYEVWACPYWQSHERIFFPVPIFPETATDPLQQLPLGARARHLHNVSLQDTQQLPTLEGEIHHAPPR